MTDGPNMEVVDIFYVGNGGDGIIYFLPIDIDRDLFKKNRN
jgi:hypothetical protein